MANQSDSCNCHDSLELRRALASEHAKRERAVELANYYRNRARQLRAELAEVTRERDYLLTGVSDSEARQMRIELQKESLP